MLQYTIPPYHIYATTYHITIPPLRYNNCSLNILSTCLVHHEEEGCRKVGCEGGGGLCWLSYPLSKVRYHEVLMSVQNEGCVSDIC